MSGLGAIRVVLDTNVVFEGLTRRGGSRGLLVDAWLAGLIDVFLSDALAYEYVDVLSRKLGKHKWNQARIVLATLMSTATFVSIHFTWRPASPDPADDQVVDCAMNANAAVVTRNRKDFRQPQAQLGLIVISLPQLVTLLARENR